MLWKLRMGIRKDDGEVVYIKERYSSIVVGATGMGKTMLIATFYQPDNLAGSFKGESK